MVTRVVAATFATAATVHAAAFPGKVAPGLAPDRSRSGTGVAWNDAGRAAPSPRRHGVRSG